MARIIVNGVALGVEDAGSGSPPFVFIHGLACDRSAWRYQVADLSRDYRCVNIDLRGRGESDATPPYDITQQADDVAAVMQALAVGPAIVAGHSLGGLTALLLGDRYPELVLGIVVGDSPLRPGGPGDLGARIGEAGSMEPVRALVERFWGEGTAGAVKDEVRDIMLNCPAEVGAGMLANGQFIADRIAGLVKEADRKPFMAIWASRPLGDPNWLRDVCMFLRQEPIAGAGHFFQLEQPAITNALLRAFVDDVERDPRLKTRAQGA
ncbi:MAG: alpha/beta hydrolase [Chloroflexi bacterium]|nr:alpha/beta hydrolase [Chloroflexota bacterium]